MQVFVALDVLAAHYLRGVGNDILRQTYLSGYLDRERTARVAYLQLEEGLHQMAVVQHGAVHHSFVVFGKVLQVLVVGGDDAERLFLVETLQHSFGNGTAYLRFGSSAKLVNQDEAAFVTVLHHDFHIGQMRRIGT